MIDDALKKRVVAIRKKAEQDLSDPFIRADKVLSEAMGSVRLLGAATPRNAAPERARLIAAFEAADFQLPRWSYARTDHAPLVRALGKLVQRLSEESSPLADVYAARATELALEASIASAVGTPDVAKLATARFGPKELGVRADALGKEWAEIPYEPVSAKTIASDAREPGSLLVRMEEAVARLKVPFTVIVQPQLAALAATGERQIFVAAGRQVTVEDIERTVMHEIEAHAIPRGRASTAKLGIFQVGTARGVDDQEGFALLLEERHGFLKGKRKRELGLRHVAAAAMAGGGDFVEVTRELHDKYGCDWPHAIVITERVFRGSNGKTAGLGRERVYLESFGRVRAHLGANPADEAIVSAGQVALDAIPILANHV